MPLLIVPWALETIFMVLGVISLAGLGAIVYLLVVKPVLLARLDINAPPPEEGFTHEILIEAPQRSRVVGIGQLDSDIKTRLNGIKEDHLVLRFEKDRELEDYEISLSAGGTVFYLPPHAKKLELLKGTETFDSRELIGHPSRMRVAASVKDNRALQYIEFELSTSYIINQFGEEKMKFLLKLTRIYPSLDTESRSNKGIYMFGRLQVEQDSEEGS